MPYAPTQNDRSGELLAEGITGAAMTRLAGKQALAAGIQSAGSAIGGGMGDALARFDEMHALDGQSLGKINAMSQLGRADGTPLIDASTAEMLTKERDPYKRAGYLTVLENQLDDEQRLAYLDAQMGAARSTWDYKRANPMPTSQPAPQREPGGGYLPDVEIAPGINLY